MNALTKRAICTQMLGMFNRSPITRSLNLGGQSRFSIFLPILFLYIIALPCIASAAIALPKSRLQDLATFDQPTSAGFRIDGSIPGERAGANVSSAGDFNGDGFDDIIIHSLAPDAEETSVSDALYIFFGKQTGFHNIDLSLFDKPTSHGFRIFKTVNDLAQANGSLVFASAGDVNNDGYDDIIISDTFGSSVSKVHCGMVYVIYGKEENYRDIYLKDFPLSPEEGYCIEGRHPEERCGGAVSGIGDLNGDGFDDIAIGSSNYYEPAYGFIGCCYVLYGKESPLTRIDLSTLSGSDGFIIRGKYDNDGFGSAVAMAGDFNGDGFDDAIIGTYRADYTGQNSGRCEILFGQKDKYTNLQIDVFPWTARTISIDGAQPDDLIGVHIASAGDFNGDGFSDVILGSTAASNNNRDISGSSYVVFGKPDPNLANVRLSGFDFPTSNGFRIDGPEVFSACGYVSGIGDFNDDGYGDVAVSGLTRNHSSFVVFGKSTGFANIDLATFDGNQTAGIRYDLPDETTVWKSNDIVSDSGDFNNDGFADLLIGCDTLSNNEREESGSTYLIFGTEFVAPEIVCPSDLFIESEVGQCISTADFEISVTDDHGTVSIVSAPPSGAKFSPGITEVVTTATDLAGNMAVCTFNVVAKANESEPPTLDVYDVVLAADNNSCQATPDYRIFAADNCTTPLLDVNLPPMTPLPIGVTEILVTATDGSDNVTSRSFKVTVEDRSCPHIVGPMQYGASLAPGMCGTTLHFEDRYRVIDCTTATLEFDPPSGSYFKAGSSEVLIKAVDAYNNISTRTITVNLSEPRNFDFTITENNSQNPLRIDGAGYRQFAGSAVSEAGDFNGDGYDDILIGAPRSSYSRNLSGSCYVLYGNADGISTISLDEFDEPTSAGFRVDGGYEYAQIGTPDRISSAGDFNADGYDDILVHEWGDVSSAAYVIFGKPGGALNMDLADWVTSDATGFRINARRTGSYVVSSAGDINGDGFDDVLFGCAYEFSSTHPMQGGATFIIYGKASQMKDLSIMTDFYSPTSAGFRINGLNFLDLFGDSVSAAGDVNGDGYDDIVIGAPGTDYNGVESGSCYVIFGKPSGLANLTLLDSLKPGTYGVRIDCGGTGDKFGENVSGAGDLNGDGFDDVIAGARFADNNGRMESGSSFVIFGKPSWTANISTTTLASDPSSGFRIDGAKPGAKSGIVSRAGDFNADGYDDALIGCGKGENLVHVVFGRPTGFNNVDLQFLSTPTSAGIQIALPQYDTGNHDDSVSNAGDFNGDGLDDLLIGDYEMPQGDLYSAGVSFVIHSYASEGDTRPPVIDCHPDIKASAEQWYGAYVDFQISAFDDCGQTIVESYPPSGSFFQVGTTDVITTATDSSGNNSTCTHQITVTSQKRAEATNWNLYE